MSFTLMSSSTSKSTRSPVVASAEDRFRVSRSLTGVPSSKPKASGCLKRGNDAHLCRVLGDAREFRSDHVSADRPAGQDEAGNADYDVEEEGEASDSCIRRASHRSSPGNVI